MLMSLMSLKALSDELWRDEMGAVVSAEAVMVATLGVAGATVGLDAVSQSINDELQDFAFAIRSLDQSFSLPPRQSAGAVVAGSSFQQASVEESHAALRKHIADSVTQQEQRLKDARQQRQSATDTRDE